MNVPVDAWGRRLADAVRTALASGDFASARRLAVEGDGQARSLAKEYAFMYRGLGLTVRLLLRLLGDALPRGGAAAADAAPGLATLIGHFRRDLLAEAQRALGGLDAAPAPSPSVDEEIAHATRVVERIEARFDGEQAQLAQGIVAALDARDGKSALALLDLKERGQYLPLHDRLLRFMADAFAWVLRHQGPAGLTRFHLATAEGQRQGFEKWDAMPAEEFARTTAFLLKQHMGEVAVREDAEKFTVEQTPCGSGGRLLLSGAYFGPDALPFVETPGPLTFGGARLPVYCSHCAIWNGSAMLRWFGRAHWVFQDPARADGGCTLHVYKRRDGTPPEYARRLALPPEEG